jgi:RNA polymerase sigma-70 factor (ECF subfamily)
MQLLSTRRRNEALTEIHARYSKKVLGFFLRMTKGNEEKAQDLVQDLFLRILEKQHLFDPKKRFYTWMFAIASNMVKTTYR